MYEKEITTAPIYSTNPRLGAGLPQEDKKETIFAELRQARNGLHELLRRMEALVDRAGLSVNVAQPQGTNANVPVPENLCMVKNEIADMVKMAHQAMDRLENIA